MRNDWTIDGEENLSDIFYSREETIQSVKENYDIRRYYSAEGYDLVINGVTERCLVQMPSNPLRELNDYRKIHCPITSDVRRGYYVNYENSVWIIDTNVANVDGSYLSTRMSRCQYLLRWQNSYGDIVERWAYASDETKYSNGYTGNQYIKVGDNQYGLLLPIDDETKKLKRGMRFPVDFDDAEEPDVYELSNRKIKLHDETHSGLGGTITISLSFDAFNKDVDKLVTLNDGREVWICDYVEPKHYTADLKQDETKVLFAKIEGSDKLKCGYSRRYDVKFLDANKCPVEDCVFNWNIISDFKIENMVTKNSIELLVENESCVGSSFLLQILDSNDGVLTEKEISIVQAF